MTEAAGTKRVNEGDNSWEGGKKMRGDTITLRFLLNAKHAGGIIGKGGETIKRLRSEFSANVTVPDTNTNERVLTIIANQDNTLNVLRECLPLVHEAPYPVPGARNEDGSLAEIDFLVHQSQVGGIIGKGGFKIKEIREATSAKVKVYAECLPDSTERVVAVAGLPDQLVAALELMLKVIDENPIKGQTTPYDPSYEHNTFNNNFEGNFGNSNNNSFGGPPSRGGMRGGRGGGGGGGGNFGPQGGYGGGGMGQQQDYGNNYSADNYSNNWNQGPPQGDYGYGSGGGGNYGGGNFGGGNNGGGSFGGGNFGGAPAAPGGGNAQGGGGGGAGGANSTQVTVPNDMAGAIIGKGGERIRQIRQKSQADIKFSDSEPGKTDRLITISGSHDQIQYAQYLMQECVRENHGGK